MYDMIETGAKQFKQAAISTKKGVHQGQQKEIILSKTIISYLFNLIKFTK
jgi:hypothetical protein